MARERLAQLIESLTAVIHCCTEYTGQKIKKQEMTHSNSRGTKYC